jgi:peptidyl-prolyl cis-trans isomerase D
MKNQKTWMRVMLGAIVAVIAGSMLLYLVPGLGQTQIANSDTVATIGNDSVTVAQVQMQLRRVESSGQMPAALQPIYAQQIIQNLVGQKLIELEAQKLGITVTEGEVADRIKTILPTAYENGVFVGDQAYAAQVSERFQMTVDEFEDLVRQSLIQEKVGELVTSGITVSPQEVQAEFRRKNEKIKIDYVVIHPDSLESQVQVSDADLSAYYDKNKAHYMVQEQRAVQYIPLDPTLIQAKLTIPPADIQAYYNDHIEAYKVQDRVDVSQILFKTVGKTDAEVAEIQKQADDVLTQLKKGAKFEDLAKKYSEDTNKDNGGHTGWIVRGQALPEFEKAAFSLPKGAISGVIQTSIGFYIIKVNDKEVAHTKSLEEVTPEIQQALAAQKAQAIADQDAQKIGDQLRTAGRPTMDALAKQYGLEVLETKPLTVADNPAELGNSPDVKDDIFRMRVGDISQPLRTDHGYVIISIKSITPAHQGTLAEMHDKIVADYKHDQAVQMASQKAAELEKRSQGGEDFAKTAKALGLDMKSSDELTRDSSIPGAGSAKEIEPAFSMSAGQTGAPIALGNDWLVYKVTEHQAPNEADFTKQSADVEQQLLDSKRQMAFDSFRTALEQEMLKEKKLTYNQDAMKQLTQTAGI